MTKRRGGIFSDSCWTAFAEQDREGTPGVVMINEAFARRYWPGQEPIGKRIQMWAGPRGANASPYLEVVGVVKDGKYVTLGEESTPFLYLNLAQHYQSSPTLIARTRGNPADYLPAARNEVAALDKSLPLYDVKTMRQHLGLALLLTVVALLACYIPARRAAKVDPMVALRCE